MRRNMMFKVTSCCLVVFLLTSVDGLAMVTKKKAAQKSPTQSQSLTQKAKKRKAAATMTRLAITQVETLSKDINDTKTKELGMAIAQALRALDIKLSYVQKRLVRRGKKKKAGKKADKKAEKRAERKEARHQKSASAAS